MKLVILRINCIPFPKQHWINSRKERKDLFINHTNKNPTILSNIVGNLIYFSPFKIHISRVLVIIVYNYIYGFVCEFQSNRNTTRTCFYGLLLAITCRILHFFALRYFQGFRLFQYSFIYMMNTITFTNTSYSVERRFN